ncbi:MAG: bifunctional salicylyl-CoA 5-hydroxylase/oxidoreductase [Deltaproteobacteria bacterium]|nr:bifunctional salicylyl-CoA 5-hydroxylase/oxidoreductase [Deltaproteobacteria bacterium]
MGGGPAGLYFSILMKKAFPETDITVLERNRADDTFGWGVVFSDETLENFEQADSESFQEIQSSFKRWRNIDTYFDDTRITSTGHGFSALSRKKLLLILQQRCRQLGVNLQFQQEVGNADSLPKADLLLAADGSNSALRSRFASHFRPSLDQRKCRFCWLGTDKPLEAFTFVFKNTEHGVFQVHAYPFEEGLSTWIVECQEDTWHKAGLAEASEADTVAFCEQLFADHLEGYRLLTNRSLWRTFATVRCETWFQAGDSHAPVVLLGDAAHTAHFSIGSGTKLAMEDAIALVQAFQQHGTKDLGQALQGYEDARWVDVIKLQKAAQTSLEWFENSHRYLKQPPRQFAFNLMTRSKRITYDNLKERDPQLIAEVDSLFSETLEAPSAGAPTSAPPPLFTPLRLRELQLENRVVVSPMCQYSAVDGLPNDWHLVHLGSRAVGGAGLVITEMTDVLPEGRITFGCTGLYERGHREAWKRIVDFVHSRSRAKIGIQLAHAGRKGSTRLPWDGDIPLTRGEGAWQTIGPSALPFGPQWPTPREMNRTDMDRVREAFAQAALWADRAGFDLIELHMAHGYLLSSFLSPLSNQRTDDFGGSLRNRSRFPLEVFRAVRQSWPQSKPISVRLSATDWLGDQGTTVEESVQLAKWLKAAGCDIIDVSSAGNSPESQPEYGRMYQVPFAEQIRYEAGIPVMAVGAILGADHANTVIAAGRADLAAMARPHLRDPYLTLHAAEHYELWDHPWPNPYLTVKPQPPQPSQRRR